ncbi:MAG: hypothetical protein J0G96_03780 [Flavobacteriia bacterium]|nr:hypothetical protein [Flavobacteriia bacterium]OJX39242.1 MAG: hypothetical protein BGO87_04455 [Flavobacteriia bacterium 40-80]
MENNSLETKEFIVAKKYVKTFGTWMFGQEKPGIWTQLVFYVNLLIAFIFLIWHLLSYYVLSMSTLIYEQKKIDIAALLQKRAEDLGLSKEYFEEHLINFQLINICIWIIFVAGLVVLWRRKSIAFWIHGFCLIAYYCVLFFYMNFKFFNLDIQLSDKIMLGISILTLSVFYLADYLQKKKAMKAEQTSMEQQ